MQCCLRLRVLARETNFSIVIVTVFFDVASANHSLLQNATFSCHTVPHMGAKHYHSMQESVLQQHYNYELLPQPLHVQDYKPYS